MRLSQRKIQAYHKLTKPGIIRGNLITAIAGYLFGSISNFDFSVLIGVIAGTYLVIAAGCTANNIIDREVDSKMDRTKNRPIVSGEITVPQALIFSTALLALGILVLLWLTNLLTVAIGIGGFIFYVFIYAWAKRKTSIGTEVGTISGSVALVAGYTAASNTVDLVVLSLFLIMFAWQMAHFFSISIYRRKEYKKAGIPVAAIQKGNAATRKWILFYILMFIAAAVSLSLSQTAGTIYLIGVGVLGAYWLFVSLRKAGKNNFEQWALGSFKASLLVLSMFSVLLSLERYLP